MLKPYYEEPGITMYHGDCRDVLPALGTVDAVISDAPYGVNFDYGTGYHDRRNNHAQWLWPIIEEAERHIVSGYMAIFQPSMRAREWVSCFPREWSLIACPKSFGQIHRSHVIRMTDYVLYWNVGEVVRWQPSSGIQRDWFLSKAVVPHRHNPLLHPCSRPIDTMTYLVDLLCRPRGQVLDCFMGAGTTLLAAKTLGRQAIGIEIEERFCEMAVKRLCQAVLPLYDRPPVPLSLLEPPLFEPEAAR